MSSFSNGCDSYGETMFVLKSIPNDELIKIRSHAASLRLQNKSSDAYKIETEFTRRYGFPSFYALSSPAECFAEIVAHVGLDPKVSDYLSQDLIKWIKSEILK